MIADDFPLTGELQGVFYVREEILFQGAYSWSEQKRQVSIGVCEIYSGT